MKFYFFLTILIFLFRITYSWAIDTKAELTIAGSYRRKKSDSGDIDLLLKAATKKTYDLFIDTLTEMNYLTCLLARGPKKYMGMGMIKSSPCHRRIDIMYTKPEEYPFAILYFTGSGDFNQRMRADALKMGFTMNEYSMKHINFVHFALFLNSFSRLSAISFKSSRFSS